MKDKNLQSKIYYWKNRERILELQKEYRRKNPPRKISELPQQERDEINAFRRMKYNACSENRKRQALDYYYRHREEILEKSRIKRQTRNTAND